MTAPKTLRKGIYYLIRADLLIHLSEVRPFEDINGDEFVICTWEDGTGIHEKVLITYNQFEYFTRIGDL